MVFIITSSAMTNSTRSSPPVSRRVRRGPWSPPLRHALGPSAGEACSGIPALLEIDLQGARQVKDKMPEALFVFLAPPSWDELVSRLTGRGTESEAEQERRLTTAKQELAAESEFNVTIVNDHVRTAAEELISLMGISTTD